MKVFSLFAILLSVTLNSYAQSPDTILITPNSRELHSRSLQNYSASYDFFRMQDGSETIIGGLEETLIILSNSNRKSVLRVCKIKFGTNSILDSGLCKLPGLAPIYHRSHQSQRNMSFDFIGNTVTGSVTTVADNSNTPVKYASTISLFDSYYEDIIAKTITLKDGLLFKFPEYIYERGGLVWSTGQVRIDSSTSGTNSPVWKVSFYERNDKYDIVRTTNYRIDQKTRNIISREYITPTARITMRKRSG